MNKQDLISVIVPCYNVEQYIDKCIECITRQTYSKLEIILVDDGATDGTGKKCDEWALKDYRIKVLHQENKGLSGARNAGIDASSGKYLSFIDSDDMIAADYVETLYNCIIDQGAPMAQGRSENFFKEEDIESFNSTFDSKVMTGIDMCHALMSSYHKGWGIVMTKMFDRRLFDDIRFPQGKIHEDEYVVYRLIWKAEKIAVSDRIVYYYRSRREGSITHSSYSLSRLAAIDARKERCEFFRQKGQQMLYEDAVMSLCRAQVSNLSKLKASDVPDKEKSIKTITGELKQNLSKVRGFTTVGSKKKLSLWLDYYLPGFKKIITGK